MPFESLVDDEISMMEDQLNESGRALETHEIQVPLGSIMHHVPSVLSGAPTVKNHGSVVSLP